MRRKYLETTKELEKRKEALVLSEVFFDTEGFDEDAQELFRYGDDETVEVHRWVNDVQWNAFRGPAKVGGDGELENEDMPAWTRKAIE